MRTIEIRALTTGDLDGAMALSSTAGWNQRLADWRMLVQIAPRGSFAAVSDERIVGTAVAIDYRRFGWIAMMLVEPAYRGRGLGGRLLEAAMGALPPQNPIRLDATPLGRPLYQRYGFVDESRLTRYWRPTRGDRDSPPREPNGNEEDVRPLTITDLPTVAEQDIEVFGADRRVLLEWALEQSKEDARLVQPGNGPANYCFGRGGRLFDHMGPIVASGVASARALARAAFVPTGSRPLVVDAFDAHDWFTGFLRASGFQPQRPLFRMCRSGPSGKWEKVNRTGLLEYAILGPEFA